MNAPPIDRSTCRVLWVKFVDFLIGMAEQNAIIRDGPESSVPANKFTYRGRELTHCPFCGVAFDVLKPNMRTWHEGLR